MKTTTIFFILLIAIATLSCTQRSKLKVANLQVADAMEMNASMGSMQQAQTSVSIVERKLIRNGHLSMKTESVDATKVKIDSLVKHFKGYVANESRHNYDGRIQHSQTIRIPAARFDEIIDVIEKLDVEVEARNINTQDVTEEFIDSEARLKTKKELEQRYLSILKDAKSVTDIVSIEQQLATVRGEIESIEGRLNYLTNQVSFSTLDLSYYEEVGAEYGFGSKIGSGFSNGWDNLLIFIIGLLNIWPFILLFTGLVWLVIRWRVKRKMVRTT